MNPTPQRKIDVYFARHMGIDLDTFYADAYIIRDSRNNSDSGFKYGCRIAIRIGDNIVFFNGQCAISGSDDLSSEIAKLLGDADSVSSTLLRKPFRTLIVDSKAYSILHKNFGTKHATQLLTALQDIAVSTEFINPWHDFEASERFAMAFIRSSESNFAYQKAKEIINGSSIKQTDARQGFIANLIGKGPKIKLSFKFDRNNFFRGRISVIIGQNGTGKTASLAKLARALADTKSKHAEFINRPELNQVLAFIHTSSRKHFTPSSKAGLARARVFTFNPATPKKYDSEPVTKLLIEVAKNHGPQHKSLNILKEVITKEFSHLTLHIPIKSAPNHHPQDGGELISLEEWMDKTDFNDFDQISKVSHSRAVVFLDTLGSERSLSLGQQSFLNFCLLALSNAGPSSAFIIDEPENFLHPNLISRFMRTLNKILNETQSIAIIATHSPFVVREVQSEQVHVMRETEGVLNVTHPRLQTLGANVASISNDVFGDDLPEHLYEELVTHAKSQSKKFQEALRKYSGELSTEALMLLRRQMESDNA